MWNKDDGDDDLPVEITTSALRMMGEEKQQSLLFKAIRG